MRSHGSEFLISVAPAVFCEEFDRLRHTIKSSQGASRRCWAGLPADPLAGFGASIFVGGKSIKEMRWREPCARRRRAAAENGMLAW